MATLKIDPAKVPNLEPFLKRSTRPRSAPGALRDRIDRIGIELEGGWTHLPSGVSLTHDGSVSVPMPPSIQEEINRINQATITAAAGQMPTPTPTVPSPTGMVTFAELRRREEAQRQQMRGPTPPPVVPRFHTGELPSPPLEVVKFPTWMRESYPSHVNESCGLHVHLSFRKAFHYQRLMCPEYTMAIVIYLSKWAKEEGLPTSHPIWKRLAGNSTYCALAYHADDQVIKTSKSGGGGGSRYTIINYCHALHSTLECRVLPMFEEVEQAIRAVTRVCAITNSFLASQSHSRVGEKVDMNLVIAAELEGAIESRDEVLPPSRSESIIR